MVQKLHIGLVALDNWMGGIVYTHNLVRALAALPPDERPLTTLFCPHSLELFRDLEPLVDHAVVYKPLIQVLPNRKFLYAARILKTMISVSILREAQPELALAARRAKVDAIFAVTNPYTRLMPNAIAWIPDLQHCVFPHLFSPIERTSRDYRISRLLRDPSRHVVFSSHHGLTHAAECYGPVRAQTHILHFATVLEPSWLDDPAPTLARYGVPPVYLMNCNWWAVHKDHGTLIRAVHSLAQNNKRVHVVCTGNTGDRRQPEYFHSLHAEIKKLGLESQFQILGIIPRIDQVMLIRGARAIVQPSRFEGWSTVIEDARALATPVIASDFPVHLEQNPEGAIFFRQGDAEDCARVLDQHLAEPSQSRLDVENRPDRVLEFARCFVDILRSAVSEERRQPSGQACVSR
jgi:glycosyltransferase involved in cell wall biosynthesis